MRPEKELWQAKPKGETLPWGGSKPSCMVDVPWLSINSWGLGPVLATLPNPRGPLLFRLPGMAEMWRALRGAHPHTFLFFPQSVKGRQGGWEGGRKRREVGEKPKEGLGNLGSSLGFQAVVL